MAHSLGAALDAIARTSEWEPVDGMARPVRIALVFLGTAGVLVALAGPAAEDVRSLAVFPAGLGAIMLAAAVRG